MHRAFTRRRFLTTGAMAGAAAGLPRALAAQAADSRPDIVVMVIDDLRFDEYGAGGHPYLQTPNIDAFASRGVTFRQAYHTTPLCSPNRACILTGQYASRHGIIDNTSRSYASHQLRTFARELQGAGYATAHIGKWHMGNDPTPRPGYEHWVSFAGQGHTTDPELFEDGRLHRVTGYVTDLLTDRAIEFVRRQSKPFMLYLGHKAVHPEIQQRDDGSVDIASSGGFVPAPRHRGRYAGRKFPRRPNYTTAPAGKPMVESVLAAKRTAAIQKAFGAELLDQRVSDATIQARAEMMLAVDESVGRIVHALEQRGSMDRTLFVFMSDNGSFFGEHGLSIERRFPYEESIRSPLIVCCPARFAGGRAVDAFALSVDIAPTLLDAAGVAIPASMQGGSLMPLLSGSAATLRDAFLVEYHGHENPFPWIANIDYRAVRMGRYKYVRWIRENEAQELYDLVADPYELRNLAAERQHAAVLAQAREVLSSLVLASLGLPSTRRL
jgi:N-acetylglucosamine-6-sulfatase